MQEVNQDTQEQNQYHESMINALTVENNQLKEENGAAKQLLISVVLNYLLLFKDVFLLIFHLLIRLIILIESSRVFNRRGWHRDQTCRRGRHLTFHHHLFKETVG